jgi:hypothetical protein
MQLEHFQRVCLLEMKNPPTIVFRHGKEIRNGYPEHEWWLVEAGWVRTDEKVILKCDCIKCWKRKNGYISANTSTAQKALPSVTSLNENGAECWKKHPHVEITAFFHDSQGGRDRFYWCKPKNLPAVEACGWSATGRKSTDFECHCKECRAYMPLI